MKTESSIIPSREGTPEQQALYQGKRDAYTGRGYGVYQPGYSWLKTRKLRSIYKQGFDSQNNK
jgi:hypothetical protein